MLYEAYNFDVWYFEMIDMANKLILTSVLPFFPPDAQVPVGLCVVVAYIMILLLKAPYVRYLDFRLHALAQTELFLLLLVGYILQKLGAPAIGSSVDIWLSVLLIGVVICLFLLVILHALLYLRKLFRLKQRTAQTPGFMERMAEKVFFEADDEEQSVIPPHIRDQDKYASSRKLNGKENSARELSVSHSAVLSDEMELPTISPPSQPSSPTNNAPR